MDLASRQCVPCKGGIPPLKGDQLRRLQEELGNGWAVVAEHHLTKEFRFKNFRDALHWG
jgi:4a-hydroxytetrahydrobiopterin dehydratase